MTIYSILSRDKQNNFQTKMNGASRSTVDTENTLCKRIIMQFGKCSLIDLTSVVHSPTNDQLNRY